MNIPEKIKIGGHIISVEKVTSRNCKQPADYDNWYRLIRVNVDSTPESMQAEGFLHEIFEAAKAIYNLDLDHKDLTILSEVLFTVIRDNKLDFKEVNDEKQANEQT